MKIITVLFFIVILAIPMLAFTKTEEKIDRISIYLKPEDQRALIIHYSVSLDLQCHFVTKSGVLVGTKTENVIGSQQKAYRILTIRDPILYLDKKEVPVQYITGDGFYSEVPIEKLSNGPHDFTWMLTLTYQNEEGPWIEEAYSLVNWSQYAVLPDVKKSLDPGNYHFEFHIEKTTKGTKIGPVGY